MPVSNANPRLDRRSLMGMGALLALPAAAQEPAKPPQAARSVHLGYPGPAGELFYNEAAVEESVPGTYFCAAGFAHGYFGIQELGNRKKVVIFSIWEPGEQNDPNIVAADRRVELLAKGEGVRTGRFGGEGTGGQSFYDYDWKLGETVRFLVRAQPEGKRTTFSAWFFHNGEKRWQPMATFRTLTATPTAEASWLRGYYAFVEDFRRDGKSLTERRRARYGRGWVRTPKGEWVPLVQARFTGDSTPVENIDAGFKEGWYYLATGGETTSTRALRSMIDGKTEGKPPVDLPSLEVNVVPEGKE